MTWVSERRKVVNVITVSRFSKHFGIEFAQKVAEKLNYRCISKEIFTEAARRYNTPEVKQMAAIDNPIFIIDHLMSVKDKYVAYIGSTLLKNMLEGNVIYHGMAGHLFVGGVSHALRVGITADKKDRAKFLLDEHGGDEEKALREVEKLDRNRQRWGNKILNMEPQDSSMHDIVLNVSHIPMDEAVDMVCRLAQSPAFQATPESIRALEDLYIGSQIKIALVDNWPNCRITIKNGAVTVNIVEGHVFDEEFHQVNTRDEVYLLIRDIEGVEKVNVEISTY